MKTVKITAVSIAALLLIFWLSSTAVARTNVSVGIGVGGPGYYPGYYPGFYGSYGVGWGGRHHHFRGTSVIIDGYWGWPGYYSGYYYPYPYYPYPGYYVAPPPPVVAVPPPAEAAPPPVPVMEQPAGVQPREESRDTQALFESLRNKKSELLKILMIGDKEHRISAIDELAGYSFDDNVRFALEKVLLSDTDPELRVAAATAFGEVKNPKAIPALEKARVQDSVTDVRIAADRSIKKIEGN